MDASRIANVTVVIDGTSPAAPNARTSPREDASPVRAASALRDAGGDTGARREAGARRLARLCGALFEEVLWIDDEADAPVGCRPVRPEGGVCGALAGLEVAAAAARGERLLWIEPEREAEAAPRADVLLALVAWPECAVVQPVAATGRDLCCAIYRRDALLARLREAERAGARPRSLEDLRSGLTVERVTLAALGLDGGTAPGVFAWRDEAE